MALAKITTFGGRWDNRSVDLVGAVHRALVATLRVPDDDPTVWHDSIPASSSIVAGRHGRDAVLVEVTMFSGRTPATALHADVSARLAAIAVNPPTVLCVIREHPPANWSIGGVPQDQVDVGFEIDV